MDNLAAHKLDRVRKLIEDKGSANMRSCYLTHLIIEAHEKAFSKIKGVLRDVHARQRPLVEAMVQAPSGKCISSLTDAKKQENTTTGSIRLGAQPTGGLVV